MQSALTEGIWYQYLKAAIYNFIMLFEDSVYLLSFLGLCNFPGTTTAKICAWSMQMIRRHRGIPLRGLIQQGKYKVLLILNAILFCVLPEIITFPITEVLSTSGYFIVTFFCCRTIVKIKTEA